MVSEDIHTHVLLQVAPNTHDIWIEFIEMFSSQDTFNELMEILRQIFVIGITILPLSSYLTPERIDSDSFLGITTVGRIKITECLSLIGWGLNMNEVYLHILHVAKHDIRFHTDLKSTRVMPSIWMDLNDWERIFSCNELSFGFMDLFYVRFWIMFSKRELFSKNKINPVDFSQFSKPGMVTDSNRNLIDMMNKSLAYHFHLNSFFWMMLIDNYYLSGPKTEKTFDFPYISHFSRKLCEFSHLISCFEFNEQLTMLHIEFPCVLCDELSKTQKTRNLNGNWTKPEIVHICVKCEFLLLNEMSIEHWMKCTHAAKQFIQFIKTHICTFTAYIYLHRGNV